MKSLKRSRSFNASSGNISSKVFIRSTRSGKVQKIVREQYLRRDISCSSNLCTICPQNAATDANGTGNFSLLVPRDLLTFVLVAKTVLSSYPPASATFPGGHYVIPDTNVLLSGMDVFEYPDALFDVIILQTVLEEIKNRSLPLYNRLMALTRSDQKRFCLFFNEFRAETFVRRNQGETINDRNDRAVRSAVAWYIQHLPEKRNITMVLLTNDEANRKIAKAEGLTSMSLHEYVSRLPDADRLLDMISEVADESVLRAAPEELLYPEYYPSSKIATGLKAGTLHQGVFNVSPYNYLEGKVKVPAFERPLLILGREACNRSISGDNVVVEILPEDQWKTPTARIIDEEVLNWKDNAEDEADEEIVTTREKMALHEEVRRAHKQSADLQAQPTARVVGVVKRNWRNYVGVIDSGSSIGPGIQAQRQSAVFLVPMDKRIPKIRIRTRQAGELLGNRVLATIDTWERNSRYPTGHYLRSLGELETKDAETEALLLEFDVQYRPFPTAVLDCLPTEGHKWKVPAEQTDPGWRDRADLRGLLVCSIDPPGCQDIDDALHARPLGNGNYEVGVHIADVSHFVQPNNAMDLEASTRGTTVYLVDKRIDMLPMLLGTDLCSLKPHVERYAFSIIWEVTPDAEVVSASFTKSVILSREGLSYEQAQFRIDDTSRQDDLTKSLRALLALSQKLRKKRMDAGALNLSSPEVRIEADSESSDSLADVKTKAHLATNSLVEEFMLLANITVAQKIYSEFPQTALLRRHATPPASNFAELNDQLKRMKGMELELSSSKALADSLDACEDPRHPFFNTLIRILATRCMTSAEYFCSGSHAERDFRHYGLASEIYTHFTSPIRRYADLLVHRQLAYAIGYRGQGSDRVDEGLRNKRKLENLCRNLNYRHRNAQMAGRASIEYYVGQALKARKEKTADTTIDVDGYVMRVFENGMVVFVPQFGVEGLVRLEDFEHSENAISVPSSTFDPENYRLQIFVKGHDEPARIYELFQEVHVRVSSEQKKGSREQGKRRVRMVVLEK